MQAEEFSRLAALAKLPDDMEGLSSLLPRLEETVAFFEKIAQAESSSLSPETLCTQLRDDRETPSLSREIALNGAGREGWFLFETKGGEEK